MPIHIFDLVSVFAFAVSGSHKALEKRFNAYGVVTCAALTALGGGTIREVILRHLPVYFSDHAYLYVTLSASMVTLVTYKYFAMIRSYALLADALGLTVFSFIGAQKAGDAGLGVAGMIFFASITAVGGGILTDLITGSKPTSFTGEMYVLPAVCGGLLYRYLEIGNPGIYQTGLTLFIPFAMRVGWLAVEGHLRLPQPDSSRTGRLPRHEPVNVVTYGPQGPG